MKELVQAIRPAVIAMLVLTGLLGIVYPLVIGGFSALAFPDQAHGSLIRDKAGAVIGSRLIGQPFDQPGYFWSRPSAATYNAMSSTGTNTGPSNPALVDAVTARVAALRAADPGNSAPVPVDLVTASASGLDPHITPAAAYYQVARVARARGASEAQVRSLVDAHVEGRTLFVLGEPRVNVLELNLALAKASPSTSG